MSLLRVIFCLGLTAFGAAARSGLRRLATFEPGEKKSQNPICLTDTGMKCSSHGDCNKWVGCSKEGRCMCPHWGCSDVTGNCVPHWSYWQETELRFGPTAAQNWFMTMKAKGDGKPTLKKNYPEANEPEGIWLLLLQPDNKTVLITTKQSRYLADGYFLDLPESPWSADKFIKPIQSKLRSARQAEWVLEPCGGQLQNFRMRHVASDRYLMVNATKPTKVNKKHAVPAKLPEPILTTCEHTKCPVGMTDFEIWPRTEHPMVAPKYTFPPAPWDH